MPYSIPIYAARRQTGTDFGKAVDFNQSNSVISYTTPTALQATSGDYAYFQDFYARTITATARRLIDQSNQGLLVIITTNGIQVQARHASTNGLIVVPISYITTREHHTLVVNWSDTMNYPEVYLDGRLFVSGAVSKVGARLAAGATTYLGNRSALDRTFDGLLDKHAFLSRKATVEEVLAFHQTGALPNTDALVTYEMDEATGDLVDSSGNGATGTPSNVTQNVASLVIPARSIAGTRATATGRTAV